MIFIVLMILCGCAKISPMDDERPKVTNVYAPHQSIKPIDQSSLWQDGAKHFLASARALQIGDILKVKVKINDSAFFKKSTKFNKSFNSDSSVSKAFNLEKIKPSSFKPEIATNMDNADSSNTGTQRSENIEFIIPATVVQVLANGHFVIYGSQEIKLNQQMRVVTVEGIAKPSDLSANNYIDGERLTQARLVYTTKGDGYDQSPIKKIIKKIL